MLLRDHPEVLVDVPDGELIKAEMSSESSDGPTVDAVVPVPCLARLERVERFTLLEQAVENLDDEGVVDRIDVRSMERAVLGREGVVATNLPLLQGAQSVRRGPGLLDRS